MIMEKNTGVEKDDSENEETADDFDSLEDLSLGLSDFEDFELDEENFDLRPDETLKIDLTFIKNKDAEYEKRTRKNRYKTLIDSASFTNQTLNNTNNSSSFLVVPENNFLIDINSGKSPKSCVSEDYEDYDETKKNLDKDKISFLKSVTEKLEKIIDESNDSEQCSCFGYVPEKPTFIFSKYKGSIYLIIT